jgi:hypothetical protein
MKYLSSFLFIMLFSSSCADYRFQTLDNPFYQYGINSISVPMFYNQSNFANVSPAFTKEVYKMLSGFKGLKAQGGNANSDATLIGIIESQDSRKQSRLATNPRSVENIAGSDLGGKRGDFAIPATNTLSLRLRVIVIKKPSKEEINLLKSNLGKQEFISSKIIFKETIPISASFTREFLTGDASSVNHSQNLGAQRNSLFAMARSASQSFREMILYAF